MLAIVATSAGSHAAAPTDIDLARGYFIEGSELVRKSDWAGARDHYQRSLALKNAAITLYSLAVAEEHLGLYLEARDHYASFLAEPSEEFTKAYRRPAEKALATLDKRLGHVDVSVTPEAIEGLTITVDGQSTPISDGATRVNPGEHTIGAAAPDYQPSEAKVAVKEGESVRVELRLERRKAPPPPPRRPLPMQPVDPEQAGPSHLVPELLIGGGSALFAVGATVGILGIVAAGDAPTSDGPAADAARTKLLVGDVLGGVGLASVGVGLFLLLTETSSEPTRAVRPRFAPFVGLRNAGVEGSF